MPARKILFLTAVLIVLGGLAFFVQGPGRKNRPAEKPPVFPGLDVQAVRSVTVTRPAETFTLSRAGDGTWRVGDEQYRADAGEMERLLEGLAEITREAVASRTTGKRELFGLGEKEGVEVILADSGGAVLADFSVGRRGPDPFTGYLQVRGAGEILLVSTDLSGVFARPVSGWRNRTIVAVDVEAVDSVTVRSSGGKVTMEKGETGAWVINGSPADAKAVSGYLDRIARMKASDFAAEDAMARAGFDEPAVAIVLGTPAGAVTLLVGALKEEARQRYVRSSDSDTVYLVSRYVTDSLVMSEADFSASE
jgi:hypothetical protein